jgi:hypothetical protein
MTYAIAQMAQDARGVKAKFHLVPNELLERAEKLRSGTMKNNDELSRLVDLALDEDAAGATVDDGYQPLFKLLRGWADRQDIESFSAACAHCLGRGPSNTWALTDRVPEILLSHYLPKKVDAKHLCDWHQAVISSGIDWGDRIRRTVQDARGLRRELDHLVDEVNELATQQGR